MENTKDQNLVDRGWKQMAEMLDAEMPVRRGRPMAIWIPLGAAAGVLLLVLLAGSLRWGDRQQTIDDVHSSEEVMNEGTISGGTEGMQNEDRSLKDSEASMSEGTGVQKADDASIVLSDNSRHATSAQNVRTKTLQDATDKSTYRETVHIPEISSGPEAHVARNAPVRDIGRSGEPFQEAHAEIDPVTALSAGPPTLAHERGVPVFEREKHRIRRVGLEVFSAGHISDLLKLRGVEGGAAMTYDISPRVQLGAGLSYGYYANDGLARIGGADEHDLALESLQGSPNQNTGLFYTSQDLQDLAYDTARLLASNFHYLHVPVNVDYRIHRSLALTGGIRLSRLLSAPSDYDVTEVENPNAIDPSTGVGFGNRSKTYLYDYDVLRKYDFSASIGLQWWFVEKWSFDVQYNHGFFPYIDRSDVSGRSDFNRSVSIGLRFRII